MRTLWKSIKWVWWIIFAFALVNLVLGVLSEIISENIPTRIKGLVFSNVAKFIALCFLHWEVVITISVVFLAFTVYVWNKERTRESTKIWELRKSNTKLIAKDVKIQKYNRAYISRQSDFDIVSLLNKGESVLITGKPNIGKTRSAFESLKKLKRVLVIKPKPEDLEEKAVGLPILGNKKIVFFIDDLQRFIGTNIEEIITKLKAKSEELVLVATCKTGRELELIREETPELLRGFTVLELDEIGEEDGKELAKNVGGEWKPEQFDGTPGSVILDLAGMTERYKKAEDGKVILKALKLMQEGNIYVHRERRVKDVCREIFELPIEELSRYKWDEIINSLIESDFITMRQKYIDIYPSYLGTCVYDYDPPRDDLILLKRLLDREKDSGGLLYLGQSFARKDDLLEAEECYRKALSIYPKYAHAHNSLGYLLAKLGENAQNKGGIEEAHRLYMEAEAQYIRAITLNTSYVSAYNNLGFVLSKLGEINEFKGEYDKAKGLYLEATGQYKKAIELRPRHASAHQNFGYTLAKLGNYKEAEKEYRESICLNAESPYAHNLLGYLLSKLGVAEEAKGRRNEAHVLYREAEKEYREAIRLKSDYPSAHNNLAYMLTRLGRLEEGIEYLRKVIKDFPEYIATYINIAHLLSNSSNFKEAEKACRRALEMAPDHVEALTALGYALGKLKSYEEAIVCCTKVIEINQNFVQAHTNLGYLLSAINKYEEAEKEYGKALEINPDDEDTLVSLGITLEHLSREKEAELCYQKVLYNNPNNVKALNTYGYFLWFRGREEEAVKQFQGIVELYPENIEARRKVKFLGTSNIHANRGRKLIRSQRLDEAKKEIREAIKLDTNNSLAYKNLGILHEETGNKAQVEEYRSKRYKQAERAHRKALELYPTYPSARRHLACVLAKLRRYEEAENEHRELLKIVDNYPKNNRDFGSLLSKIGKKQEAMIQFELAISLFEQHGMQEEVKEVKELIEHL